jgi:malate dehydrogenase
MIKRPKVSIVGAGTVGTAAAQWIASMEVADVVLTDIVEGLPQGKALDILQAGPIAGFDATLAGTQDYGATAGSDIVIITAGVARKPGMTRRQLIHTNTSIVRSVVESVVNASPGAVLIILTNPLDPMTYLAYKVAGLPRNRVIGQSGALDAARFCAFLAMELGVSVQDITGMVIGAHTEKEMVPLPRLATVRGIPISHFLSQGRIDHVVARTRRGGAEIVELIRASGYTAAGAALYEMVESILKDKKRVIASCVYLDGEYGERDVCAGVPVVLGAGGMEKIIEAPLNEEEQTACAASVESIREMLPMLEL